MILDYNTQRRWRRAASPLHAIVVRIATNFLWKHRKCIHDVSVASDTNTHTHATSHQIPGTKKPEASSLLYFYACVCACDCDDDVSAAFVYTATHFCLGHAAMHPNATNDSSTYSKTWIWNKFSEIGIHPKCRWQTRESNIDLLGSHRQRQCGKLRSNDVRRRDDHKQQFSTNKMNWQPRRHININFFDASTIRELLLLLLHQL